jgi:excisionase family DNA binding protein
MSLQSRYKKPQPKTPSAIPFSGPRMMSPEKAAEYIAVSIDIVYEMIQAGKIPVVPKGNGKRKLYTIDRCDLDNWIDKNKTTVAA